MKQNHIIVNTNASDKFKMIQRENPIKLYYPKCALYVPSHDEAQALIKKYNLLKGEKIYV